MYLHQNFFDQFTWVCDDDAYSGRIDAGDLLVALRALGFEPRKDEVKKLMSDNDKENTGTITKQQFVEIFRAKWVSIPGICVVQRK